MGSHRPPVTSLEGCRHFVPSALRLLRLGFLKPMTAFIASPACAQLAGEALALAALVYQSRLAIYGCCPGLSSQRTATSTGYLLCHTPHVVPSGGLAWGMSNLPRTPSWPAPLARSLPERLKPPCGKIRAAVIVERQGDHALPLAALPLNA